MKRSERVSLVINFASGAATKCRRHGNQRVVGDPEEIQGERGPRVRDGEIRGRIRHHSQRQTAPDEDRVRTLGPRYKRFVEALKARLRAALAAGRAFAAGCCFPLAFDCLLSEPLLSLNLGGLVWASETSARVDRSTASGRRRRALAGRVSAVASAFHLLLVHLEGTAMNASCGISTLPTLFMRRLPSRCFSSSLRFRVMSPP